jgi:hypothetical protein
LVWKFEKSTQYLPYWWILGVGNSKIENEKKNGGCFWGFWSSNFQKKRKEIARFIY